MYISFLPASFLTLSACRICGHHAGSWVTGLATALVSTDDPEGSFPAGGDRRELQGLLLLYWAALNCACPLVSYTAISESQ